jgi:uncharacterized protein
MIDIIVHVKPGSSRNQLFRDSQNEIIVKLRAKPIDGEANAALVEFLCSELKIRKSDIEIVKGTTSRTKKIRLAFKPEEWERLYGTFPLKK